MTVELDNESQNLFGKTAEHFIAKAKFYQDSDHRCFNMFAEDSLLGIDLRRNTGFGVPENQTKAIFKYHPNKTQDSYTHEIFFTMMNSSKILKVEYDVNMTTKEQTCQYTMKRASK